VGPTASLYSTPPPKVERDGRILGGHLDRLTELPDGVWSGVLDAHAPQADGQSEAETLDLAAANARHAERIGQGHRTTCWPSLSTMPPSRSSRETSPSRY
jgi:hypothetical protein